MKSGDGLDHVGRDVLVLVEVVVNRQVGRLEDLLRKPGVTDLRLL